MKIKTKITLDNCSSHLCLNSGIKRFTSLQSLPAFLFAWLKLWISSFRSRIHTSSLSIPSPSLPTSTHPPTPAQHTLRLQSLTLQMTVVMVHVLIDQNFTVVLELDLKYTQKSENFVDSNIFCAQTFRIKCALVLRDISKLSQKVKSMQTD